MPEYMKNTLNPIMAKYGKASYPRPFNLPKLSFEYFVSTGTELNQARQHGDTFDRITTTQRSLHHDEHLAGLYWQTKCPNIQCEYLQFNMDRHVRLIDVQDEVPGTCSLAILPIEKKSFRCKTLTVFIVPELLDYFNKRYMCGLVPMHEHIILTNGYDKCDHYNSRAFGCEITFVYPKCVLDKDGLATKTVPYYTDIRSITEVALEYINVGNFYRFTQAFPKLKKVHIGPGVIQKTGLINYLTSRGYAIGTVEEYPRPLRKKKASAKQKSNT